MKSKMVWLMLSSLMVLSLVLVSCAPAAPPAEEKPVPPTTEKPVPPAEKKEVVKEEAEMVKVRLTKSDGTVVERLVEKPRYGGVFTHAWDVDDIQFDEYYIWPPSCRPMFLTNEDLIEHDWAKGPTGTEEASFIANEFILKYQASILCESWEMADENTFVYHIRKGINFQNKPPVNGREMTAYDVAFSMRRITKSPTSYLNLNYPNTVESVEATDKWTVVYKCKPGWAAMLLPVTGGMCKVVPPEVYPEDAPMKDWTKICGTGPFLLSDYVSGSSLTYVRNPNYWRKDPINPENTLPYLDGVKQLIITDLSTRQAALRTGKIDHLFPVSWEDATQLRETAPELKWKEYPSIAAPAVMFRTDKPELPFKDIRVRQALNMAIDRKEIAETLRGGKATILCYPCAPYPEYSDFYTPLEELPESTRELYEYNPEKAKQLLAEAGYPDGFKTEILCTSPEADDLAVVKAFWAKVGVDAKLDVREYAVKFSIVSSRTHKECVYWSVGSLPYRFMTVRPEQLHNLSMINDPRVNEAWKEVSASYFDEPKKHQIMKEIFPYILSQAWWVQIPGPYYYISWQPWVKGYAGQIQSNYVSGNHGFAPYIWIDQDLKEKMTGQR